MPNRRGSITIVEILVIIAIAAILAALLFPVFAMARLEARYAAAARGEYKLNEGDIKVLRQSSRYERVMRKHPRLPELYPELRTPAEQEWMQKPETRDITGPTASKTLAVTLADGRVVKVIVTIPAGSDVSSVAVLPDVVEAAPPTP